MPSLHVDSPLPPLPQILQDEIRQRVFTHRSYYGRPTNVFEDRLDDLSPDNEKFEHLGDVVLNLLVTRLVLEIYPGLRVGPATKVRAMIVGNATLAEISVKYGLPKQLRLHPAQAITLYTNPGVQADLFESFIGGLFTDQNIEVVKAWLDVLLRPYVHAAYAIVRAQHGLPPVAFDSPTADGSESSTPSPTPDSAAGHLQLFNQHLQKGAQHVEWVYSDQHPFGLGETAAWAGSTVTPVWSVQVVVDGAVLGHGRGNTKKAARNEAAKEGLARLGVMVWCISEGSTWALHTCAGWLHPALV